MSSFLKQSESSMHKVPTMRMSGHAQPVFASGFTVCLTANEVSIIGHTALSSPEPTFVLGMSPQAAKDLAMLLADHIRLYELNYGALRTCGMEERSAQAGRNTLDG